MVAYSNTRINSSTLNCDIATSRREGVAHSRGGGGGGVTMGNLYCGSGG